MSSYFETVCSEAAWRREVKSKKYSDLSFSKALDGTSASEWGRGQLVRLRVVMSHGTNHKLLPLIAKNQPANAITKAISRAAIESSNDAFWSEYPGPGRHCTRCSRAVARAASRNVNCGLSRNTSATTGASTAGYGLRSTGSRMRPPMMPLHPTANPQTLRTRTGEEPGPGNATVAPSAIFKTSPQVGAAVYGSGLIRPKHPHRRQQQSSVSARSLLVPHSAAYVPAAEAICSSARTEDLTVDFIVTALRIILLHFLDSGRDLGSAPTVDLDVQKLQLRVTISNLIQFGSIDDGGLWIRSLNKKRRARVALLEAKRFIGHIDDGHPVLSDAWLAQIVGEALAVRLAPDVWAGPHETVIVIAAARYFVRFFQLHVTDSYLNDLSKCVATEAAKPKTEPPAAPEADDVPRESIRVSSTRWFDFRELAELVYVMRNLSGIIKLAQDEAQG
ncbi:LOW QUALITY PROTEIN: hypothetical protein Ct61P_15475 [Colletotrichum tofieldiae]|nr:LOW QUALITY PROTEIN: hypothetical protein Ct61P_15475 [Colletotrichum tofieldiae]